ncbi:MAG: DNA polymerase III subunit delta [Phycisphaerales bacterium]
MATRRSDPSSRSKAGAVALAANMPIVILHGKESLLLHDFTEQLQSVLDEAHGEAERFVFDGATVELAMVLDELRSYGLMMSHKLVVVDQADAFMTRNDSGYRRAMERYAENPVDHATLLLRAETWRPGNFDKAVRKIGGEVVKCEPLGDAAATAWCISRAEKVHGVRIEKPAAALLVERSGTGLTNLDSELGRLASLVDNGAAITRDIIAAEVEKSREEQGWEIQQAVLSGNAAFALERLRELVEISRTPEPVITWALADLARKLYAAAQMLKARRPVGEIASTLRLWGPSRDAILNAARRCEPARFAAMLDDVTEGDARSKSGLATSSRTLEGLTVTLADTLR